MFTMDNRSIGYRKGPRSVRIAAETVWSVTSARALGRWLEAFRPSVAHFHNTFPLISPSGYYVCRRLGIPVVQTLHNYRIICPSGTLFRSGEPCERCVGRVPIASVRYGCYRSSRLATAPVAAMTALHDLLRTWRREVDLFIALSEFSRERFISGGLPPERIVVLPNCVFPDPGERHGSPGDYAVYVGRAAPEKGIPTLMEAWRRVSAPLVLVGATLEESLPRQTWEGYQERITFAGELRREDVLSTVKQARFLVAPSVLYENHPMVVAEAYACGVPVVASRRGALAEWVKDGTTGLLFEPGDPLDLAERAEWSWNNPAALCRMGTNARRVYEERLSSTRFHQGLMDAYARVVS
jgi:glycosyltransferase involved in cell wall biosynthesis